jgi:putative spermidine/putrescine transport system ATP-binding protein
VRLGGFGPRMPAQLSGGQQQRVALARAAVYDPPLLLMDEPLGALDKNLREEMQEELRQFHHTVGATILYVTHDQQEAASMADRIAIMNHGKAEQIGSPHEVYDLPSNSFVARFLGEANMFRLRQVCADGSGHMRCDTEEALSVLARGAASGAVACVRPEDITIATTPTGRDNCFPGRIVDLVQVAGSVRYRVAVTPGCTLSVRASAERRATVLTMDDAVHVGWDAADMLVLPA